MKKLTLVLFSILIAFSYGCNDDDDDMNMEPQFEVVWEESFENESSVDDWYTQEDPGPVGWCGNIYHRDADEGSVTPSGGMAYAEVEHGPCNAYYTDSVPIPGGSAPYGLYDDYSDEWPSGGFKGDLDIYLDPNWTGDAEGFIFSYANAIDVLEFDYPANIRYFALDVVKDNDALMVAGNEVSEEGWYTFRFDYSKDSEDSLSVNFQLLQDEEVMFTEPMTTTLFSGENTSSFAVENVGTGYSFFPAINDGLLLPIDKHQLLYLN